MKKRIYEHLVLIYGEDRAQSLTEQLWSKLEAYARQDTAPLTAPGSQVERVSEADAILITYGDMVRAPDEMPLATLASFLTEQLAGVISTVHLLPFFPYSSDDGFSVIDYLAVEPAWGDWSDVSEIGRSFRLMFDAVVNHISAESAWFAAFKRDDPAYRDFFTVVDPKTDLTAVFRPRALPLLTPVDTAAGTKHVWTTFSDDQIDLNYANPDVLFAVIDVLLFYVAHGAEFIRLDAIAFIWKESGTDCIHLPQTHEIIKLMRTVLDVVAPRVSLITETNVPHKDNIAYFGNGRNEAQMVYNFSLPPLTLHTFHTGNAETLSHWAATLEQPSDQATFFNFLASHDGIGLTPARGLLPETAVSAMAQRVEDLGGFVSYKSNSDGSQSAYELNINYLDALGNPAAAEEPPALQAQRFLAAQAIMLALRGVPGIYFHSLFGSQNWREGVAQTGRNRTINRQKLQRADLTQALTDPTSLRHLVFNGYLKLLRTRKAEPAFHPHGGQAILPLHPAVFAVHRTTRNGRSQVLCLQNVADKPVKLSVPVTAVAWRDLLSDEHYSAGAGQIQLTLRPYQVAWLRASG